jgi:hypothetical protein
MELSDAGQQAARRLVAAVQDARVSDAHAADALAMVVLAVAPLDELDAVEQSLLAGLAFRAGVAGADSKDALVKIDAYFQAHPLPDDLAKEITAVLREVLASSDGGEQAAAALGAAADAASKVPVQQRAPTAGAQRMGVMGRFGLTTTKK